MNTRASGILLHITSLPSLYGIGDLGPSAYWFVDILARTHQQYWQILPLTPTEPIYANSPYSSPSAFAGNRMLISPDLLVKEGWLKSAELKPLPRFSKNKVNYQKIAVYKERLFETAFNRFLKKRKKIPDFEKFCRHNRYWLNDYAMFMVLKFHFMGHSWNQWPKDFKLKRGVIFQEVQKQYQKSVEKIKFLQFIFYQQWISLKKYCHRKNVQIIGDIPIYVNFDSADAWSHPKIFKLKDDYSPRFVSGVPPDYFSKTGQRWGNPVYDWKELKRTRYHWWIQRFRHNLKYFDYLRIDHFRGFAAYWQVSAAEKTAIKGRWIKVPGNHFFKRIKNQFKNIPIIAEDIGYITPDVIRLMKNFNFPGMKVLQFAFDGKRNNTYLPHKYPRRCVAYTGTHDNNTIRGWFKEELNAKQKTQVTRYIGKRLNHKDIHWEFIKLVMHSKANVSIIPLQDFLGLGKETRMNTPATDKGNWNWRFVKRQLNSTIQKRLKKITKDSHRH